MASTNVNTGSGYVGAVNVPVAQDTIATEQYQIVKLDVGALGSSVPFSDLISGGALNVNGGGGTEYTEGDTDASITGKAMMMEGAANTLVPAQGTAADGMLVNLGANNDVTVAGVSTAANQATVIAGLTSIDGHVDGIEALIGTTNSTLTTIDGRVDGIETLIGTSNTTLAAIDGHVDGIEALIGTTNTTLTTIDGRVDGIETLIGTTNTTLTTIDGRVDGIEALLGTSNTNTGSTVTSLQLIDDAVATVAAAITTKGIAAVGTDGTNARIFKTDASGELQIDVLTLPALAAGTNNIGDVDVLTLPALPAGTNNIGDVDVLTLPGAAHDAAISGNPVRIAGRAATSDYTAVAAGDTSDVITTLTGKPVTYPFALPGQTWSYAAASGGIVNTTGITIKAAAGAGIRNYITCLSIINGHATTGTDVQIRDGASGTVLWRGYAYPAGGGVREVFSVPLRGSTNTLLEVACGTTASAVYVNVQGFSAAE